MEKMGLKHRRNIMLNLTILFLFSLSLYGCGFKDVEKSEENVNSELVDTSVIGPNLLEDYESLEIRDIDNVRGNLQLPLEGSNGSKITWVSEKPTIISDKEIVNDSYDNTPIGVVHRQDTDVDVVLTANLTLDDESIQKKFIATVKAKYVLDTLTDYIFTYFTGDGKGQESIHFAASKDGFSYKELNYNKPIIESVLGTRGLRDPFILRSKEGDKFYMIATDLCIANDGDWWKAQSSGSTSIMIWESYDLVNWSEQRMVKVNSDMAGCTWAPEAYYDDITGEYLVFFASRVKSDNYSKQRVYYTKTRDFYTFTEPKIWIDYEFSTIDTTVVKDNDMYYRFTKYEEKSTIILEKADSLLGTWTRINSTSLEDQEGVEGPYCFLLNEEDVYEGKKWALLLDKYGSTGYYLMVTDNLDKALFEKKKGYKLPSVKPRHGTVMAITSDEYTRLMKVYTIQK